MKANLIKMRTQNNGEFVEVKLLMQHPMETGRRKNEAGSLVDAHFIQLVTVTLNGNLVLEGQWGIGVAKDPYLSFALKNVNAGDLIEVTWHDNMGKSAQHRARVD
ncbi:MAG: thiosulfate oxidation carrier complex protein SoxZ [Betaproteobacteria bacterium HGW-Betaproteobacteria-22]|nr:MAG: thiosulfate oxidation carrier complex protein SoxZ [Betaproteobacteria bacterium HGW-Betaproteobacteria-22]